MVSLRKFIIPFLIVQAIIIITACSEKLFTADVDCNECYTDKPDSALLIIHITLNEEFEEIPVLIYSGNIDNGEFIDTFYCFKDPAEIRVKAVGEYSAKAIYQTNEKTVYVVDGTELQQKRVTDFCEETCWISDNNELFLSLSY